MDSAKYVSLGVTPPDAGVLEEIVDVAEIAGTGLSGRMMGGVWGVQVSVVLWVIVGWDGLLFFLTLRG